MYYYERLRDLREDADLSLIHISAQALLVIGEAGHQHMPEKHRQLTGRDNANILACLLYTSSPSIRMESAR